MSLETQTHKNLLFNVSTGQYAGITEAAKKRAAKANGVSQSQVQATTVLRKETTLSALFGVGAETIEVSSTAELAELDQSHWKGADAVTTLKTSRGKDLGVVSSSTNDAQSTSVAIAGKPKARPEFDASTQFAYASLQSMVTALREADASPAKPSMGSTPVMQDLMPAVFKAEEPIKVFGTPANDAPSFARFVEAVSSAVEKSENGFGGEVFLGDMKLAMPSFFQLLAANDDDGAKFGGRAINGFAQEAVTFAHEGLGVRRDVIDMRQGEAQERFMSVMKRIASYEEEAGHYEAASFGLDLNEVA